MARIERLQDSTKQRITLLKVLIAEEKNEDGKVTYDEALNWLLSYTGQESPLQKMREQLDSMIPTGEH